MPTATSPTLIKPKHPLTLTDGSSTLGFQLSDGRGRKISEGEKSFPFRIFPLEQRGLQTFEGQGNYDDFRWPYMTISQSDWSGGRGSEVFEDDKTKYMDASRMFLSKTGQATLGGAETFGYGDIREWAWGDCGRGTEGMSWVNLISATPSLYRADSFTTDASGFTADKMYVIIRKVGTPGDLTVAIYSHSGSTPNAVVGSTATAVTAASITDSLAVMVEVDFTGTQALTGATTYWLVAYGAAGASTTNCWQILQDSSVSTGKISNDGSSWSSSNPPWFRVVPASTSFTGRFLTYKSGLYFMTQPDSGNSLLYLNGDRGAADSNTGAEATLVDVSKASTWIANEWIGAYVILTAGPGSDEAQPWREIIGSSSSTLTVSPSWNVVHTTSTEYVIVGSDKWQQVEDLGAFCTDAAVADKVIYFARGSLSGSSAILRYEAYNNAGTWTDRNASEGGLYKADFITAIRNPEDNRFWLYTINTGGASYKNYILSAIVPGGWAGLEYPLGEICSTLSPWNEQTITNVTNGTTSGFTSITIAAGFTTGIVASKAITSTDISAGKSLGAWIYSSVACTNADDLKLCYSDHAKLQGTYTPSNLVHSTGGTPPTYTAMGAAKDADADIGYTLVAWATGPNEDFVYVGNDETFNKITVDLGATVNAVVSTLTAEYYNGNNWAALTITDGTKSGSTTMAQDGVISFTIPSDWATCIVSNGEATPANVEGYYVRLMVSATLTASIIINEVTVTFDAYATVNMGALLADTWTWVDLSITPGISSPDCRRIVSIGLYLNADLGAQTVYIYGGIQLLVARYAPAILPNNETPLGIIPYSGNTTDPRENPWIRTSLRWYELQTQNDNALVPLPIGEMAEISDDTANFAACVNDVYLYFSLGNRIEQYYARNLVDVSPQTDYLPQNRRGTPAALLSYPGHVYAAIDAGSSNYSSIMVRRTNAWHEVYRAPQTGQRIRAMGHQNIPGSDTGRLWFLMGADLAWVPTSLDPLNDTDFPFAYEGYIETGWIYANLHALYKIWRYLNVFCENTTATTKSIYADYMADGDTSWTAITTEFLAPLTRNELAATPITKYRVRFRFRFTNSTGYVTSTTAPLSMKAWAATAFGVDDTKYGYQVATLLADPGIGVTTLDGEDVDSSLGNSANAETALAILAGWVTNGTPLTMNSWWSVANAKTVKLQPYAIQPTKINPDMQEETHVLQLTLYEI